MVDQALTKAGKSRNDISAVAFTRGPGLLGSLLVGTSFAKRFALVRDLPLIKVNDLQAHVMAHFALEPGRENRIPGFPIPCLLVSGGHTQLIVMHDHLSMELIGNTIDDDCREAFDKCAKVTGLPYPGGPVIDRLGRPRESSCFYLCQTAYKRIGLSAFRASRPASSIFCVTGSGRMRTSLPRNMNDIAASLQNTIIEILVAKLVKASKETGITEVGIAGGVSANSGLRKAVQKEAEKRGWNLSA